MERMEYWFCLTNLRHWILGESPSRQTHVLADQHGLLSIWWSLFDTCHMSIKVWHMFGLYMCVKSRDSYINYIWLVGFLCTALTFSKRGPTSRFRSSFPSRFSGRKHHQWYLDPGFSTNSGWAVGKISAIIGQSSVIYDVWKWKMVKEDKDVTKMCWRHTFLVVDRMWS